MASEKAEELAIEFGRLAHIYEEYRRNEIRRPLAFDVTEDEALAMHEFALDEFPRPQAGDRFEFMGVPCKVLPHTGDGR